MENNGSVKWKHFISSLAIIVTVGISLTGGVIASNNRLRLEDRRLEDKIETVKDCFHSIDIRLSRIEERLGILGVDYANYKTGFHGSSD